MSHRGKNWPLQEGDLFKLSQNNPRIVLWMYLVTPEDKICTVELRKTLKLNTLVEFLQKRRSKWFGHPEKAGREFPAK